MIWQLYDITLESMMPEKSDIINVSSVAHPRRLIINNYEGFIGSQNFNNAEFSVPYSHHFRPIYS